MNFNSSENKTLNKKTENKTLKKNCKIYVLIQCFKSIYYLLMKNKKPDPT